MAKRPTVPFLGDWVFKLTFSLVIYSCTCILVTRVTCKDCTRLLLPREKFNYNTYSIVVIPILCYPKIYTDKKIERVIAMPSSNTQKNPFTQNQYTGAITGPPLDRGTRCQGTEANFLSTHSLREQTVECQEISLFREKTQRQHSQ